MVQYLSIEHGNTASKDESLSIDDGALLAAYEAPRGSSSVSEVTAGAPAMPVDRVAPALRDAWREAGHPREPRVSVSRSRSSSWGVKRISAPGLR